MINVIKRDKRIKTRRRDNRKAYRAECGKYQLSMTKPDGTDTTTGMLPNSIYEIMKPMSCKERYLFYSDYRINNTNNS